MRGTDNALLAATYVPQTGDSFARLGAPVGASISADIADGAGNQVILMARLTAARAGYLDQLAAAAMPATLATILADTNELQTNQGNWVTAVGFSTLTQAQVQTQVAAALAAFPCAKPADVRIIIP